MKHERNLFGFLCLMGLVIALTNATSDDKNKVEEAIQKWLKNFQQFCDDDIQGMQWSDLTKQCHYFRRAPVLKAICDKLYQLIYPMCGEVVEIDNGQKRSFIEVFNRTAIIRKSKLSPKNVCAALSTTLQNSNRAFTPELGRESFLLTRLTDNVFCVEKCSKHLFECALYTAGIQATQNWQALEELKLAGAKVPARPKPSEKPGSTPKPSEKPAPTPKASEKPAPKSSEKPAPTPKASEKPAPTRKTSEKPGSTPQPSEKPANTSKSSEKPGTTPKPSEKLESTNTTQVSEKLESTNTTQVSEKLESTNTTQVSEKLETTTATKAYGKPTATTPKPLEKAGSEIILEPSANPTKTSKSQSVIVYLIVILILVIVSYILYYNKGKIKTYINDVQGDNKRRRPNTKNYNRLDANVGEVLMDREDTTKTYIY